MIMVVIIGVVVVLTGLYVWATAVEEQERRDKEIRLVKEIAKKLGIDPEEQ